VAHAEALRKADPNSHVEGIFGLDYRNAGFSPRQVAMLEFAEHLTRDPSTITEVYHLELRNLGWRDEDIIDMVHVVALYNYMVRIADGLGAEMEAGREWEPVSEKLPFKEGQKNKTFVNLVRPPK